MTLRSLSLAALGLLFAGVLNTARGAEFDMSITLNDLQLSETITGEIKDDAFKDRVVLVQLWGARCPRCAANMPSTVRLNAELSSFGLTTVGAHMHSVKDEEVQAKVKSLGITPTVAQDQQGLAPHPHAAFPAIRCGGQCIYRGGADGLDKPLRAAVGKTIVGSLDNPPESKPVQALAAALTSGQAPSAVLLRAVPLLTSKDTSIADEAKALVEKLCAAGQAQLNEADTLKKDDPYAAYIALEKLPIQYRGTPLAANATKVLAELKKDEKVALELKARPALATIKKIDDGLTNSARLGMVEITDPRFLRANAMALQSLRRNVLAMKKSWPDSKATETAVEIAEKYGIMLP